MNMRKQTTPGRTQPCELNVSRCVHVYPLNNPGQGHGLAPARWGDCEGAPLQIEKLCPTSQPPSTAPQIHRTAKISHLVGDPLPIFEDQPTFAQFLTNRFGADLRHDPTFDQLLAQAL